MKKIETIINIATIILVFFIIIACIYIANQIKKDTDKVYVQTWTCPETNVSYIITQDSIIEMRNLDGTLYQKP